MREACSKVPATDPLILDLSAVTFMDSSGLAVRLDERERRGERHGYIDGYLDLRRELLLAVDPSIYSGITGATDSELMFHLALTIGLQEEPLPALERMAGFVEDAGRRHDIEHPLQMTVAVSDVSRFYGVNASPRP